MALRWWSLLVCKDYIALGKHLLQREDSSLLTVLLLPKSVVSGLSLSVLTANHESCSSEGHRHLAA
jgi:hypothetical protein